MLKQISTILLITWRLLIAVVTNIPTERCDKDIADGKCFGAELLLTANQAISAKDWQIHFSQISPIQSFESDEFTVTHINGDLHRISLSDKFSGFAKNESKRILFREMFWSLSETDAIPNHIVSAVNSSQVNNTIEPKVIKSTMATINPETGLETLPFVEAFTNYQSQFKRTANDKTKWLDSAALYQRNLKLGLNTLDVSDQIIPTLKSIILDSEGKKLNLAAGIKVSYDHVEPSLVKAALERLARLGIQQSKAGVEVKLTIAAQAGQIIR